MRQGTVKLYGEIKKLNEHPKVVALRRQCVEKWQELRARPQHPAVAALRDAFHPQYVVVTVGGIVAMAMIALSVGAISKSQNVHIKKISQEAGERSIKCVCKRISSRSNFGSGRRKNGSVLLSNWSAPGVRGRKETGP